MGVVGVCWLAWVDGCGRLCRLVGDFGRVVEAGMGGVGCLACGERGGVCWRGREDFLRLVAVSGLAGCVRWAEPVVVGVAWEVA